MTIKRGGDLRNDVGSLRRKLLAWYRREKRSLPWRGTRDPYRIWVSEIMLQQTTVETVRARYETFLERFPDLPSLARASEDAVLAAWSGLGYYARARNLRLAAREIWRRHDGQLPKDSAELRRLPGFGDYTAAAVACLAFGSPVPAVEANVTRVLSRLFAIGEARPSCRKKIIQARAAALLPAAAPGNWTAALMDLGQLICTPRRPQCPVCPLRSHCAASRLGTPEAFPRRQRSARPVTVFLAAADAREQGRALLVRRESGFLRKLWEFPSALEQTEGAARKRLAEKLHALGLRLASWKPAGTARHSVMNLRIKATVFRATREPRTRRKSLRRSIARWFRPRELSRAAIPTLTRKLAVASGFLPSALGEEPRRPPAENRHQIGTLH